DFDFYQIGVPYLVMYTLHFFVALQRLSCVLFGLLVVMLLDQAEGDLIDIFVEVIGFYAGKDRKH
ncbi:hypothetical protein, partial [Pseudomonas syringae group genomosp. 7]|uniref:hypothetical protein n=1 Tax=Pseudomonas syringae group genomosp. 7 TaxID=251699 RepID=UPI00376FD85D